MVASLHVWHRNRARTGGDFSLLRAPLWPAGHLPCEGGDHSLYRLRQTFNVSEEGETVTMVISPLAGEMAGRPEGGAKKRESSPPRLIQ